MLDIEKKAPVLKACGFALLLAAIPASAGYTPSVRLSTDIGKDEPLLQGVYAPRAFAVPPDDATRDLCVTADGEIRHYGYLDVNGVKRRAFIASRNGIDWSTRLAAESDPGAMVRSPWSGEWIYFNRECRLIRSKTGPGGADAVVTDLGWSGLELRQLIPMKSRKRWIAAFSDVACRPGDCYHAKTAYSDDDGKTWKLVAVDPVAGVARIHPGGKRRHWFNNGCEPSVVELRDGTLLMSLRTSGPHHAFCTSSDGGETWSAAEPDAAFFAMNTMPLFFRLSDGRLLFFWNNTTALPTLPVTEHPEIRNNKDLIDGVWESVFTNRDALHAAVSEDDGKTWKGFREIALNPIRNRPDFRSIGVDAAARRDKSVHQTQAIELAGGKVLLAYGQNRCSRRIIVFDPDWLLESERKEDFRGGLENLSNHLYVKSVTGSRGANGHCSWNRLPGAVLARDPDLDREGKNVSRESLKLCRIEDPRLVSPRQGAVWNFPAATAGKVTLECRLEGEGFRLTLAERWINPCDWYHPRRAPVSIPVDASLLPPRRWHNLEIGWDYEKNLAVLRLEGKTVKTVPLGYRPRFGLSYLHLQTLAEDEDVQGSYFRSFSMTAER